MHRKQGGFAKHSVRKCLHLDAWSFESMKNAENTRGNGQGKAGESICLCRHCPTFEHQEALQGIKL